ncbi:eukaryotic translation initiation factor 3 subunit 10 [Diplonema papillatum]|nr:eukaryotic translation initiation factor 3 subunit 10 [Diplonema papillatum]
MSEERSGSAVSDDDAARRGGKKDKKSGRRRRRREESAEGRGKDRDRDRDRTRRRRRREGEDDDVEQQRRDPAKDNDNDKDKDKDKDRRKRRSDPSESRADKPTPASSTHDVDHSKSTPILTGHKAEKEDKDKEKDKDKSKDKEHSKDAAKDKAPKDKHASKDKEKDKDKGHKDRDKDRGHKDRDKDKDKDRDKDKDKGHKDRDKDKDKDRDKDKDKGHKDRDKDKDRRRRRRDPSDHSDRSRSHKRRRPHDKDRAPRDRQAHPRPDAATKQDPDQLAAEAVTPVIRIWTDRRLPLVEADVREFLKQWQNDVGSVRVDAGKLPSDSADHTYVLVTMADVAKKRRVLDFFGSSRGKRFLAIKDTGAQVQSWPPHGVTLQDAEAALAGSLPDGADSRDAGEQQRGYRRRGDEGPRGRKRQQVCPLLSEEFPEGKVIAFDSTEQKRYAVPTGSVHRTDGAVSLMAKLREDGTVLKRTICHYYKHEGHCKFAGDCAYVHVNPAALCDENIVPSYPPGASKGGKFAGGAFLGSAGKGARFLPYSGMLTNFQQQQQQLQLQRLQQQQQQGDADSLAKLPAAAQPAAAAAPAAAQKEPEVEPVDAVLPAADDEEEEDERAVSDYRCCLLVREIDRDTDARGMVRMSVEDFATMWCEIDGFVAAKLYRDDSTRKYGGSYGIVAFSSNAEATEALAQTFGCGLNVSYYGVEEMIEDVSIQQQLAMQQQQVDTAG